MTNALAFARREFRRLLLEDLRAPPGANASSRRRRGRSSWRRTVDLPAGRDARASARRRGPARPLRNQVPARPRDREGRHGGRGIVIGSTIKGLIAGLLIGYFARRIQSIPLGIVFGLVVGLILAFLVAAMPSETGKHYYFEIMLPGAIVGAIVGFPTQKFRSRREPQPART